MRDLEAVKKARVDAHRKSLIEEENHYKRLKEVFGTDSGKDTLEWLLDLCGYWATRFSDDRAFGKFELGRLVFDQICMADIDIAHDMLDRRRRAAGAIRNEEKRKLAQEGE